MSRMQRRLLHQRTKWSFSNSNSNYADNAQHGSKHVNIITHLILPTTQGGCWITLLPSQMRELKPWLALVLPNVTQLGKSGTGFSTSTPSSRHPSALPPLPIQPSVPWPQESNSQGPPLGSQLVRGRSSAGLQVPSLSTQRPWDERDYVKHNLLDYPFFPFSTFLISIIPFPFQTPGARNTCTQSLHWCK